MFRMDRQRRKMVDGMLQPEQQSGSSSADALATEEVFCEEEPLDNGDNESINATILPLEEPSTVPSTSACTATSKSKSVAKRDATAAALENTVASKMPTTPFSLTTPIASVVEPSQPNQLLASSILSKSKNDNAESRKRWEIEKFDKVVTFVRKAAVVEQPADRPG